MRTISTNITTDEDRVTPSGFRLAGGFLNSDAETFCNNCWTVMSPVETWVVGLMDTGGVYMRGDKVGLRDGRFDGLHDGRLDGLKDKLGSKVTVTRLGS